MCLQFRYFDRLMDTVHRMQNFTTWNEKIFTGKLHDWMEIYAQDEGCAQ